MSVVCRQYFTAPACRTHLPHLRVGTLPTRLTQPKIIHLPSRAIGILPTIILTAFSVWVRLRYYFSAARQLRIGRSPTDYFLGRIINAFANLIFVSQFFLILLFYESPLGGRGEYLSLYSEPRSEMHAEALRERAD